MGQCQCVCSKAYKEEKERPTPYIRIDRGAEARGANATPAPGTPAPATPAIAPSTPLHTSKGPFAMQPAEEKSTPQHLQHLTVLVSYRVRESGAARELTQDISARGYDTTCSSSCEGDLPPTADWTNTLCSALEGCPIVIMLATKSPSSMGVDSEGGEDLGEKKNKPAIYFVPMTDKLEESASRVTLGTMQNGKRWTTAADANPQDSLQELCAISEAHGLYPDMNSAQKVKMALRATRRMRICMALRAEKEAKNAATEAPQHSISRQLGDSESQGNLEELVSSVGDRRDDQGNCDQRM